MSPNDDDKHCLHCLNYKVGDRINLYLIAVLHAVVLEC